MTTSASVAERDPASNGRAVQETVVRRVVVVHGYGAKVDSHWFPWLSGELQGRGIDVEIVELPAQEVPVRAGWDDAVAAAVGPVDVGLWLVGHSLGAITALRNLAAQPGEWVLGGVVLVSGFTGQLADLPELDAFLADDVELERIAGHIGSRLSIRSDNDAIVDPAASDALAARLGASTVVVPGAGHFLGADGFTELPEILEAIVPG